MSCAVVSRRDTCILLRRRTTELRTLASRREPTSPAADRPRCSASSTSTRRRAGVRPWTRPPDCWEDLRREGRRSCREGQRRGTAGAGRRPAARQSATKPVGLRTQRTPSAKRRRSGRCRTSSRRRRGRRRRRHDVAGGRLTTPEHRRPSLCIIGRVCHVVGVVPYANVSHIGFCCCCCCCCCYTRDERQLLGGRPAPARCCVASPCAEHWRRYNSFIKQRRVRHDAPVAGVIIRRARLTIVICCHRFVSAYCVNHVN